MENTSAAFLAAVRKSMSCVRSVLGAAFADPRLLIAAEKLQSEGYLRREELNAAILARAAGGASIKEIMRETGHSRGLVRRILRGQRSDSRRHLPPFCARRLAARTPSRSASRRTRVIPRPPPAALRRHSLLSACMARPPGMPDGIGELFFACRLGLLAHRLPFGKFGLGRTADRQGPDNGRIGPPTPSASGDLGGDRTIYARFFIAIDSSVLPSNTGNDGLPM